MDFNQYQSSSPTTAELLGATGSSPSLGLDSQQQQPQMPIGDMYSMLDNLSNPQKVMPTQQVLAQQPYAPAPQGPNLSGLEQALMTPVNMFMEGMSAVTNFPVIKQIFAALNFFPKLTSTKIGAPLMESLAKAQEGKQTIGGLIPVSDETAKGLTDWSPLPITKVKHPDLNKEYGSWSELFMDTLEPAASQVAYKAKTGNTGIFNYTSPASAIAEWYDTVNNTVKGAAVAGTGFIMDLATDPLQWALCLMSSGGTVAFKELESSAQALKLAHAYQQGEMAASALGATTEATPYITKMAKLLFPGSSDAILAKGNPFKFTRDLYDQLVKIEGADPDAITRINNRMAKGMMDELTNIRNAAADGRAYTSKINKLENGLPVTYERLDPANGFKEYKAVGQSAAYMWARNKLIETTGAQFGEQITFDMLDTTADMILRQIWNGNHGPGIRWRVPEWSGMKDIFAPGEQVKDFIPRPVVDSKIGRFTTNDHTFEFDVPNSDGKTFRQMTLSMPLSKDAFVRIPYVTSATSLPANYMLSVLHAPIGKYWIQHIKGTTNIPTWVNPASENVGLRTMESATQNALVRQLTQNPKTLGYVKDIDGMLAPFLTVSDAAGQNILSRPARTANDVIQAEVRRLSVGRTPEELVANIQSMVGQPIITRWSKMPTELFLQGLDRLATNAEGIDTFGKMFDWMLNQKHPNTPEFNAFDLLENRYMNDKYSMDRNAVRDAKKYYVEHFDSPAGRAEHGEPKFVAENHKPIFDEYSQLSNSPEGSISQVRSLVWTRKLADRYLEAKAELDRRGNIERAKYRAAGKSPAEATQMRNGWKDAQRATGFIEKYVQEHPITPDDVIPPDAAESLRKLGIVKFEQLDYMIKHPEVGNNKQLLSQLHSGLDSVIDNLRDMFYKHSFENDAIRSLLKDTLKEGSDQAVQKLFPDDPFGKFLQARRDILRKTRAGKIPEADAKAQLVELEKQARIATSNQLRNRLTELGKVDKDSVDLAVETFVNKAFSSPRDMFKRAVDNYKQVLKDAYDNPEDHSLYDRAVNALEVESKNIGEQKWGEIAPERIVMGKSSDMVLSRQLPKMILDENYFKMHKPWLEQHLHVFNHDDMIKRFAPSIEKSLRNLIMIRDMVAPRTGAIADEIPASILGREFSPTRFTGEDYWHHYNRQRTIQIEKLVKRGQMAAEGTKLEAALKDAEARKKAEAENAPATSPKDVVEVFSGKKPGEPTPTSTETIPPVKEKAPVKSNALDHTPATGDIIGIPSADKEYRNINGEIIEDVLNPDGTHKYKVKILEGKKDRNGVKTFDLSELRNKYERQPKKVQPTKPEEKPPEEGTQGEPAVVPPPEPPVAPVGEVGTKPPENVTDNTLGKFPVKQDDVYFKQGLGAFLERVKELNPADQDPELTKITSGIEPVQEGVTPPTPAERIAKAEYYLLSNGKPVPMFGGENSQVLSDNLTNFAAGKNTIGKITGLANELISKVKELRGKGEPSVIYRAVNPSKFQLPIPAEVRAYLWRVRRELFQAGYKIPSPELVQVGDGIYATKYDFSKNFPDEVSKIVKQEPIPAETPPESAPVATEPPVTPIQDGINKVNAVVGGETPVVTKAKRAPRAKKETQPEPQQQEQQPPAPSPLGEAAPTIADSNDGLAAEAAAVTEKGQVPNPEKPAGDSLVTNAPRPVVKIGGTVDNYRFVYDSPTDEAPLFPEGTKVLDESIQKKFKKNIEKKLLEETLITGNSAKADSPGTVRVEVLKPNNSIYTKPVEEQLSIVEQTRAELEKSLSKSFDIGPLRINLKDGTIEYTITPKLPGIDSSADRVVEDALSKTDNGSPLPQGNPVSEAVEVITPKRVITFGNIVSSKTLVNEFRSNNALLPNTDSGRILELIWKSGSKDFGDLIKVEGELKNKLIEEGKSAREALSGVPLTGVRDFIESLMSDKSEYPNLRARFKNSLKGKPEKEIYVAPKETKLHNYTQEVIDKDRELLLPSLSSRVPRIKDAATKALTGYDSAKNISKIFDNIPKNVLDEVHNLAEEIRNKAAAKTGEKPVAQETKPENLPSTNKNREELISIYTNYSKNVSGPDSTRSSIMGVGRLLQKTGWTRGKLTGELIKWAEDQLDPGYSGPRIELGSRGRGPMAKEPYLNVEEPHGGAIRQVGSIRINLPENTTPPDSGYYMLDPNNQFVNGSAITDDTGKFLGFANIDPSHPDQIKYLKELAQESIAKANANALGIPPNYRQEMSMSFFLLDPDTTIGKIYYSYLKPHIDWWNKHTNMNKRVGTAIVTMMDTLQGSEGENKYIAFDKLGKVLKNPKGFQAKDPSGKTYDCAGLPYRTAKRIAKEEKVPMNVATEMAALEKKASNLVHSYLDNPGDPTQETSYAYKWDQFKKDMDLKIPKRGQELQNTLDYMRGVYSWLWAHALEMGEITPHEFIVKMQPNYVRRYAIGLDVRYLKEKKFGSHLSKLWNDEHGYNRNAPGIGEARADTGGWYMLERKFQNNDEFQKYLNKIKYPTIEIDGVVTPSPIRMEMDKLFPETKGKILDIEAEDNAVAALTKRTYETLQFGSMRKFLDELKQGIPGTLVYAGPQKGMPLINGRHEPTTLDTIKVGGIDYDHVPFKIFRMDGWYATKEFNGFLNAMHRGRKLMTAGEELTPYDVFYKLNQQIKFASLMFPQYHAKNMSALFYLSPGFIFNPASFLELNDIRKGLNSGGPIKQWSLRNNVLNYGNTEFPMPISYHIEKEFRPDTVASRFPKMFGGNKFLASIREKNTEILWEKIDAPMRVLIAKRFADAGIPGIHAANLSRYHMVDYQMRRWDPTWRKQGYTVFPFFAWTSGNLWLHANQYFRDPIKYLTAYKAMNTMNTWMSPEHTGLMQNPDGYELSMRSPNYDESGNPIYIGPGVPGMEIMEMFKKMLERGNTPTGMTLGLTSYLAGKSQPMLKFIYSMKYGKPENADWKRDFMSIFKQLLWGYGIPAEALYDSYVASGGTDHELSRDFWLWMVGLYQRSYKGE